MNSKVVPLWCKTSWKYAFGYISQSGPLKVKSLIGRLFAKSKWLSV
jgi:hypothetical protein